MLKKAAKWILVIGMMFILYNAAEILYYSKVVENDVKADAAIVLGAAAWNGKPSPVLEGRINHAIELYQNKTVDKIIFTGGKAAGEKLSESEASKLYAMSKGVSEGDIFLETQSTITEENLKYAKELAEKENLKTFVIVSDPLHMKRAIVMAEDLGLAVHSSPTPESAYKTYKTKIPFFLKEWIYLTGYQILSPFHLQDSFVYFRLSV
ncbi:YdcF family protein [Peribacillus tepidiphilus]|uniref:YdcF family protein n=1 Tax=Peribacillus tepidiphilus TaxID=2652445 RepID=UPI003B845FF2